MSNFPLIKHRKKTYNFLPGYDWNQEVFSYFCCMRKYIEYISDLLYLHDCVIIPDFGGFICNYTSAYIDENSGLLCPPGKDILFNRNLTHNDGLLLNWIAAKENISYAKASTQLTLFCEDLKIRLNQGQRLVFGDIGVFYTDRRFNIVFENSRHNFFADALGMESLATGEMNIPNTQPVQISMPPVAASDKSAYINMESSGNFLQRLLKYGLAVAVVTGVVVISQLGIFHKDIGLFGKKIKNASTLQPELPALPTDFKGIAYDSVISPDYDYVEYDPLNDLAW